MSERIDGRHVVLRDESVLLGLWAMVDMEGFVPDEGIGAAIEAVRGELSHQVLDPERALETYVTVFWNIGLAAIALGVVLGAASFLLKRLAHEQQGRLAAERGLGLCVIRAEPAYALLLALHEPAELDIGNPDSNLCLNCHQGRASSTSVSRSIADLALDEPSDSLRFLNVHYFAAGATLFGTEAKGAYEFDGKEYLGRNEHVSAYAGCTDCHSTHQLEVKVEECSICHAGTESEEDLHAIRIGDVDYDGDGDTEEGVAGEIETCAAASAAVSFSPSPTMSESRASSSPTTAAFSSGDNSSTPPKPRTSLVKMRTSRRPTRMEMTIPSPFTLSSATDRDMLPAMSPKAS